MTHTGSATVGDSSMLKQSETILLSELASFRNELSLKARNARMISILQQFPCLLKCVHALKSPNYDDIDPLYSERHSCAKIKILEAIRRKFSRRLEISSEEETGNGRIDILLYNSKTGKRVGIEVKSGRSIGLFQIERYLNQLDSSIVVRVPTRQVAKISREEVIEELHTSNLLLIEKIRQIREQGQGLIKIKGEWCTGCTALCPHRKAIHDRKSIAPLHDYPEFIKNVNTVTNKVIDQLELEFGVD